MKLLISTLSLFTGLVCGGCSTLFSEYYTDSGSIIAKKGEPYGLVGGRGYNFTFTHVDGELMKAGKALFGSVGDPPVALHVVPGLHIFRVQYARELSRVGGMVQSVLTEYSTADLEIRVESGMTYLVGEWPPRVIRETKNKRYSGPPLQ